MERDDEKHRSIISGLATLVVHAVLLLIPTLTKPMDPPGPTITGYVTGLVEIRGSEGDKKTAIVTDTATSSEITVKPAQNKHDRTDSKPSASDPQPGKAGTPTLMTGEKTAVNPPQSEPSGVPKGSGDTALGGSGTQEAGTISPSAPARPGLGTGQGQVMTGGLPIYPKNASNEGITGAVLYRLVIDATGQLIHVELQTSSGDPRLDAAALRAVKRWRFREAAADYFMIVKFNFSPQGKVDMQHLNAGWVGDT